MQIKIDLSDVTRIVDGLERNCTQAISRALNRTIDSVEVAVRRTLSAETGIGVRQVREHMRVEHATTTSLEGSITIENHPTYLREFNPRQLKRGVSARPWGKRKLFRGTFLVESLDGGVFVREGEERGPIRQLHGPNLARETEHGRSREVAAETARTFARRLQHELSRLLKGS